MTLNLTTGMYLLPMTGSMLNAKTHSVPIHPLDPDGSKKCTHVSGVAN